MASNKNKNVCVDMHKCGFSISKIVQIWSSKSCCHWSQIINEHDIDWHLVAVLYVYSHKTPKGQWTELKFLMDQEVKRPFL